MSRRQLLQVVLNSSPNASVHGINFTCLQQGEWCSIRGHQQPSLIIHFSASLRVRHASSERSVTTCGEKNPSFQGLGNDSTFSLVLFLLRPFLCSEIRWNDSNKRKHTFLQVFWGSGQNLFLLFFFFLPAVNGYRTAFMPTKKYLGFTHIGIVLNTGSFYLDG